jgi:hypothetical protein
MGFWPDACADACPQAFHIVCALDFSATGEPARYARQHGISRGDFDKEMPVELLPTAAEFLAYSSEVRASVKRWLVPLSDAGLMRKTPWWGWRERAMIRPSHITYVLRHATFHLGLFCAIRDSRGIRYAVFK